MIVRMKHLDLVCVSVDREATLTKLRELGTVHLDLSRASGSDVAEARGEAEEAERAVRLILKARGKTDTAVRERSVADVLALDADRATLKAEKERLEREVRRYAPYGDFSPELAAKLASDGVSLKLLADGTWKFSLSANDGDPDAEQDDAAVVPLPEMRLAKMREKLDRVSNRLAIDEAKIAQCDERAILRRYPQLADRIAFASALELMSEQGAVSVISGWLPENRVNELRAACASSGWGVLLRDPAEDENPPTLVEPPRLFRPMKALFDGLGISPAYTESDVSVPFMCYFSIFFAMLVGDGAYGSIFLAATLALRKKMPKSWFVLMTVFSVATVGWGLLSNTWFGAGLPFAANWPSVRWLADPSYQNMMFLCFTIGVSHLVLARLWNGLCALNDTRCLAQFGWAGVLAFMYCVTNAIVGIFSGIPTAMFVVFGVSLVAVFAFTLKPSELKSRGAELGMLPLNIMSALGDIISYVRLFAVGLASVKVAENFNAMATGLLDGADALWLKALMSVAMVAILVLGHTLNLAMAGLSILVHAVRLNTLEFSNHKGVTWSGLAYRPFLSTRQQKIK